MLTCVTTGGPVTRVAWRKGGRRIAGSQSQNVSDYADFTYANEIAVTGIIAGEYEVNIVNDLSAVSSTLDLTGIYTTSFTQHLCQKSISTRTFKPQKLQNFYLMEIVLYTLIFVL